MPGEGAEQCGELVHQAELRLCFREQGGGQAALPPPRLQEKPADSTEALSSSSLALLGTEV